MKKIIFWVASSLFLICSAVSAGEPLDKKFPVSNKGMNSAYYDLSTKMNWKTRVTKRELKNYISWRHAIDLILDNQVASISQSHSLQVDLFLTNGKWVSTIEPDIDTVSLILKKCGKPCDETKMIME